MPYPTITGGGRLSTTTTYGGQEVTKIQQLLSGTNIASVDATNKPDINTDFLFRSGRLKIRAVNLTNELVFNAPTITSNISINFPNNLLNGSTILFDNVTQNVSGKSIDASVNAITNLDGNNFKASPNLPWSYIAKSGSKLGDLADVYTTGLANNQSPVWNSTTQRWEPRDLTNPDILLPNKTTLPVANSNYVPMYRNDLSSSDQRVYISKLENGVPVIVRVC